MGGRERGEPVVSKVTTMREAVAEIVHDAGAEVAVGEPIAWLEDGS